MGRVGGFIATGKIVHDDAVDFDGTFTHMNDTNDRLELSAKQFWAITTRNATPNYTVAGFNDALKFIAPTSYITTIKVFMNAPYAERIALWRLGTSLGDSSLGSGSYTVSRAAWKWYTITLNAAVTKGETYYLSFSRNADVIEWGRQAGAVSSDYTVVYNGVEKTTSEWNFKLSGESDTGDYESQSVFVGAGVTWGTIAWDEVLDGATIVAKVRASDDEIDWTAWQTLNSGDQIAVKGDYLQYGFWITNGTTLTEIDNVEITYAL